LVIIHKILLIRTKALPGKRKMKSIVITDWQCIGYCICTLLTLSRCLVILWRRWFCLLQTTKLNVYKNDSESWDYSAPNLGKWAHQSLLSPYLLISCLCKICTLFCNIWHLSCIFLIQCVYIFARMPQNKRLFPSIASLYLLNTLTPELNPAQRCLTRFFTGVFASWTVHFVNICVKN
jgi:hypothetical protein